MAQISLLSTAVNLNFTVPVKIGELEATLVAAIWVHYNFGQKTIDCEFVEADNISYMGVPMDYTAWNKFRTAHKEIGINFDKILSDKFDEIFNEYKLNELVNKYVINSIPLI